MGKFRFKDKLKTPDQPIPAQEIQAHYAAQLEVQLAVIKAQQEISSLLAPAKARFTALCEKHGVNQDSWDFDLKTGKMTLKPAMPDAPVA